MSHVIDPADFARLAASAGLSLPNGDARSLDLLFDGDLPVTVYLYPDQVDVGVDIWCYDLSQVTGQPRRLAIRTLLRLNVVAQPGLPCVFGLDSRDYVLVHGRCSLASLAPDAFFAWLEWLVSQAGRTRDLLATLTLADLPTFWSADAPSVNVEY